MRLRSAVQYLKTSMLSDVPCLPSRTALLTGRFGIHNGVVNHGGTDADPVFDGAGREFWSSLQLNSLPTRLKVGVASRADHSCVRCRSVHSPNATPPFIGMRVLMRPTMLVSSAWSLRTRFMPLLRIGCSVRVERTTGFCMCICGTRIHRIVRQLAGGTFCRQPTAGLVYRGCSG